jgi:DNA-binding transcriptional regulator YdaS (Cro superfamily)
MRFAMMMRPVHTLREWFELDPRPMSRYRFAKEIGVTPSYVTRLCKEVPPWPSRELARKIGEVTEGWVTPNDLAGYGERRSGEKEQRYELRPRRYGQAFDLEI